MALIKIESAEVTRHVGSRGAFAVGEYITLPTGASFMKTYTVWNDATVTGMDAPTIGNVVQVIGELGVKVREYTNNMGQLKHAADISINNPQITQLAHQKPATVEDTKKAIDTIVDDIAENMEAPF